jgi:hypothetical protein
MFDAAQGGGEAEEAFRLLGFSQKELVARQDDVNGVFTEALTLFGRMEDGAERNAVGQQLWGDASIELGAAIRSMPLEEGIELAERWGRTVDEQDVVAARNWSAALADLSGELTGIAVDLGGLFDAATGIDVIRLGFAVVRDFVSQAATEVGEFIDRVGDLASAVGDLDLDATADKLIEIGFEGQKAFADIGAAVLSSGDEILDVLRRTADAIPGVELAAEDATDALTEQPPVIDDINLALGRLAQQTAREAEERKKAAAEAAKAAKEREKQLKEQLRLERELAAEVTAFSQMEQGFFQKQAAAALELRQIEADANRELLSEEELVLDAFEQRREAIDALARQTSDLGAIQDATAANKAQRDAELLELEQLRQEELQRSAEVTRDTLLQLDELQTDLHNKRLGELMALVSAGERVYTDLASAAATFAQLEIDRISAFTQAYADQNRDTLAAQEETLEQLATAETEAEVISLQHRADALQAQADMEEQFLQARNIELAKSFRARHAGLAVGIGATTAAQIAVISSQQPPPFPVGFPGFTQAGETLPALIEPGEAVTTRAVTEALGGSAEVERMNQGGAVPQGSQLPPASVDRNGLLRMLGMLVAEEAGNGRELSRTLGGRRSGGLPPVGKRPVFTTRR